VFPNEINGLRDFSSGVIVARDFTDSKVAGGPLPAEQYWEQIRQFHFSLTLN
jgi:hypothetical protein